MKYFYYITLMIVVIGFCGCETTDEQQALTQVAKHWNSVIRASQIYPIYPLSQDVMPGDMFLHSKREDSRGTGPNGYLPLDRLVARIYPTNYSVFYTNAWPEVTNARPHEWLQTNSWTNAPVAAFPSYSFSIKKGASASVALPIQGIPIGLSLMGASDASCMVTLADAHTYGVDEISLRRQVEKYVSDHQQDFADLTESTNTEDAYYLQVVTRVYTVGQVSVSMYNDSSAGGSIWGGSPKDTSIPMQQNPTNNAIATAAANFSNMVNTVNATVPSASNATAILPGGSLKFSVVSSRSVSMNESFPKPVVIGYLFFAYVLETSATNALFTSVNDTVSNTLSSLTSTNLANLARTNLVGAIQNNLSTNGSTHLGKTNIETVAYNSLVSVINTNLDKLATSGGTLNYASLSETNVVQLIGKPMFERIRQELENTDKTNWTKIISTSVASKVSPTLAADIAAGNVQTNSVKLGRFVRPHELFDKLGRKD